MSLLQKIVRAGVAALALLLLLAAGLIALSWAPDRPPSALAGRWAPPPSQFLEVGGLRVHLRDEGPRDDARPMVLLHGTSASLHTWDGWTRELATRHRVIRIDLPGFGLTGPAPGDDYSLAAYTRFLAATLDALGVRRCTLAGNSFGGRIAWQAALDLPDRVERLILVDAGGYPSADAKVPIGFRAARIPVLRNIMEWILPRRAVESSVRNVYGHPERVTPELVDRYYDLTLRAGNRHALAERFRQTPSDTGSDEIARLRLPVLILWGGRDQLIPPAAAERFHHDIAGSRVVMFDDLGHVPHEEDPARTVAAVLPFVE